MRNSRTKWTVFSVLMLSIFTCLPGMGNAGLQTTLISGGDTLTFIWKWKDGTMPDGAYLPGEDDGCFEGLEAFPREVSFKLLDIEYGDANPNYTTCQRNNFYWAMVDEPASQYTGQMFIGFSFWDTNWIRSSILYYKKDYILNTGSNSTFLGYYNDTGCIASSGYASKSPAGISDLVISPPVVNAANTSITWSTRYTAWSASVDDIGTTYDWTYNTSFCVNHTFHFSLQNNASRLKVDIHYSNFNMNPLMRGDKYGNATLVSNWDLNVRHPISSGESPDWTVNGETIQKGYFDASETYYPGDVKKTTGEANFTIDGISISTIDFGDEFVVNNTATGTLFTNVSADDYGNEAGINDYLHMKQLHEELNLSRLETIDMDPEIAIYYSNWPSSDYSNKGKDRDISSYPMIYFSVLACATVAFLIWKRRKTHSLN